LPVFARTTRNLRQEALFCKPNAPCVRLVQQSYRIEKVFFHPLSRQFSIYLMSPDTDIHTSGSSFQFPPTHSRKTYCLQKMGIALSRRHLGFAFQATYLTLNHSYNCQWQLKHLICIRKEELHFQNGFCCF